MIVNVLKDFPFSRDGIHTEFAVKGTPVDVPDGLLIGLMSEKYIAVPDAAVVVAPMVAEPAVTFDPSTATVEELQTFLRSKGIQFHHKAGVEKLRALVPA